MNEAAAGIAVAGTEAGAAVDMALAVSLHHHQAGSSMLNHRRNPRPPADGKGEATPCTDWVTSYAAKPDGAIVMCTSTASSGASAACLKHARM